MSADRDELDRLSAAGALILTMVRVTFPSVDIYLTVSTSGHLVLDRLVIASDERRRGLGTDVMRYVCAAADSAGLPLACTPSTDFGGTKAGLDRFYRRFGFKPNRGQRRDFTTRETMVRPPGAGR